MRLQTEIKKAAEAIQKAEAIIITAGAGLGVDSGLPDFRGNRGFWNAYPPMEKLGISFVEMANPSWFVDDPELAWGFYGHRMNLYKATKPHEGFQILLNWAKQKTHGYFVFTSNVDNHFQKAGFDNQRIYEVHGSIMHLQCTIPCTDNIWDVGNTEVIVDTNTFRAQEPLPRCPQCGALARPNVLMFGDWLWVHDRSAEQSSRFNRWINNIHKEKIPVVIIEAGAGTGVPTVRMKSQQLYSQLNADFIRINPREPDVPGNAISLPMGTKEALNAILKEM